MQPGMPRVSKALLVGALIALVASNVGAQRRLRFVVPPAQGGGGDASNPINTMRRIDWSVAGRQVATPATGLSTCYTDTTTLDSIATINTKIQECGDAGGGYVILQAGSYTFADNIHLNRTNVVVKGQGADATLITFTGGGGNDCGGLPAGVCINGGSFLPDPAEGTADNERSWTPDASPKGDTTLVCATNCTGLSVGSLMYINQQIDVGDGGGSTTDTWPEVWFCHRASYCTIGGEAPTIREQHQMVRVTNVAGTTVTFTPGLYLDNWRTARNPEIWYQTSSQPAHGMGVEDLSLTNAGGGGGASIFVQGAYDWYVYGVRSVNPGNMHIKCYMAMHGTVAFSYFYGWDGVGEAYGIDPYVGCDSNLFHNNILSHVGTPTNCENGSVGNVWAYNYAVYSFIASFPANDSGWGMGMNWTHNLGCDYQLYEGNQGMGLTCDNDHGSPNFTTAFRNMYEGWDVDFVQNNAAIHSKASCRFTNVVGNVLGHSGYHTTYQNIKGVNAEDFDACSFSVYAVGWGGNCDDGGPAISDNRAGESLFRWGNWDVVTSTGDTSDNNTDGIKWDSGEVPSGIAGKYANTVPADHNLPASLIWASEPAWSQGPWPICGPDVTGSQTAGANGYTGKGGHCYENPAKIAADAMGVAYANTSARTFNRATRFPGS